MKSAECANAKGCFKITIEGRELYLNAALQVANPRPPVDLHVAELWHD